MKHTKLMIRKLLKKIYSEKEFSAKISARLFPISINFDQGTFLRNIVDKKKPKVIVECGFGFGISSLWMLSANYLPKKYYIIDSYREKEVVKDFIYKIVTKSKSVEFVEKYTTQQFLANLDFQGRKADLIFMDAEEKFDGLLVDSYFAFRILDEEGEIIFRNIWNPSIRKVLLFYSKNLPVYFKNLTTFQNSCIRFFPSTISSYLLKKWLGKLDFCVVKLTKKDIRDWDNFRNF